MVYGLWFMVYGLWGWVFSEAVTREVGVRDREEDVARLFRGDCLTCAGDCLIGVTVLYVFAVTVLYG